MKPTILGLLMTFTSAVTLGQSFSVSELQKIYSLNNDDAETLILKKGYEYAQTDKNDSRTALVFSYDASKSNRQFSNFVIFLLDYSEGGDRTISHQTSKSTYVKAKLFCKANKYKITSTETTGESLTSTYEKENWIIEFTSFQNETQDGSKITSYMIKVSKRK